MQIQWLECKARTFITEFHLTTVLFLADENSGLNGSIRSSNWVELNNGNIAVV